MRALVWCALVACNPVTAPELRGDGLALSAALLKETGRVWFNFHAGDPGFPTTVRVHAVRPVSCTGMADVEAASARIDIDPWALNPETVLAHELGHALGLGHSADPANVMYEQLIREHTIDEAAHDLAAGCAQARCRSLLAVVFE